jgi:hypothetical protein
MGGRKGKTRPRRPTSLEQARRTVAALEELLHSHLAGLNLPTDPLALIDALQALEDDSPLALLKEDAYYAVVYLEMTRDEIDPLNPDPDPWAVVAHIAMATLLIQDVPGSRKLVDRRLQRSAARTRGTRVRAKRYMKQRLDVTPTIDRHLLADSPQSDSAIADRILKNDPDLGKSTVRRWIRDRRTRL